MLTPSQSHPVELVMRLMQAFPELDVGEIREAVAGAQHNHERARLRLFVSLLVERDAKADCRRRRAVARARAVATPLAEAADAPSRRDSDSAPG